MSSDFDEEVRRAIEQQRAEDEARQRKEKEEKRQREQAARLRALEKQQEEERQLAEIEEIGRIREAFKLDIVHTIQHLRAHRVPLSTVAIFAGPRPQLDRDSTTPIEVPKPPRISRRPSPPSTELHGWVIGANGLGRNDEREYEKKEGWNSHDRWPYPDLGEYHEVAYWRTTWKEDYLLCRGGSIRLIATGDDGTTGSVQWYSVNIIGAPEGSVHAISRWQQEWHVKLIETAAHYTK